jgi:branched-chain amino acid transport system permease protein
MTGIILADPVTLMPTKARRRPWWIGVVVAVVLLGIGAVVPYVVPNDYVMRVALEIVTLGIFALSVGFLARFLGLYSLGQAAFFGGGAYALAIAMTSWGWGLTQAAIFGVVVGTAISFLMGLIVVRTTGMAFLMLTLALAQALYQLVVQTALRPVTGAYDGLTLRIDRADTFFALPRSELSNDYLFWYPTLVVLVIAGVATWLVGRSRFGTTLEGIRENEERMRFTGFGTFAPRLTAFVISGAMASAAGVLTAVNHSYVSPEMLSFTTGANPLVAAIIGGVVVVAGPILGAALYVLGQVAFNDSGNLPLFMGAAIVLVLVFLPGGITGALRDGFQRMNRRRKERS